MIKTKQNLNYDYLCEKDVGQVKYIIYVTHRSDEKYSHIKGSYSDDTMKGVLVTSLLRTKRNV